MRTPLSPATSLIRLASTPICALALATAVLVMLEAACASDPPAGAGAATSSGASPGAGAAGANFTGAGAGGSSGSGGGLPGGAPIAGSPGSGGASIDGGSPTGGGSGMAGGSASAGVGGGEGSLAVTGCSGKTYKLCEDFETGSAGSLGADVWSKLNGYGTPGANDVALATDAAHSGKMSLKSDSIHRGQVRAQRDLMALGATAYKHWGRIFYKVQQPSPPPQKTATNTVIHITWTSLIGPGGENRVVDLVENMSGAYQWLFNIPSDNCCSASAYDWKFDDAWHCAEWWVDVSTNSFRFFSDSTEVTALAFTGKTNSTMSNYTSIVVGATWYQQEGTILSPFVAWFDDLAIDDNRIGCQ